MFMRDCSGNRGPYMVNDVCLARWGLAFFGVSITKNRDVWFWSKKADGIPECRRRDGEREALLGIF